MGDRGRNAGSHRIFGVILAACIVLPAQQAVAGSHKLTPLPSAGEITRYFDTIVFGAEINRDMASTIIYKRTEPIQIGFQGKVAKQHIELVRKHIAVLSRLTGLKFEGSNKKKPANLKIVFVPRDQMGKLNLPQVSAGDIRKLGEPGGCYFVSYKSGPDKGAKAGQIHAAIIVVNAERDMAGINHCLLEEITQSLGLPNDSNALRPSIFSDLDRLYALSRVDMILIRTLYHKQMRPGLPRAEALALASAIITKLLERLRWPSIIYEPPG